MKVFTVEVTVDDSLAGPIDEVLRAAEAIPGAIGIGVSEVYEVDPLPYGAPSKGDPDDD
jgi:hypothetical protein